MAADGAGENGVYTKYLLQTMALPGLSIEQVFKQVRYGVVTETEGKQTPWESSSLLGDLRSCRRRPTSFLLVCPPTLIRLRSGDGVVEHERAVVASGGCAGLLQAYPESRFAPAARLRLQQLQQQSTFAANVPTAPLPGPATPSGEQGGPSVTSTSAPPQQSIERAVPSNVPSPTPSAEGYTLIRRIYCEDTQSGAIQGKRN